MLTRNSFLRYNIMFILIFLLFITLFSIYLVAPNGLIHAKEKNSTLKCQGEEKDPWLSAWRANMEKDKLYLYAVKLFNTPISCEGKVTDSFDDIKFGILKFTFTGGNELRIETSPPETSRITLRVPRGFPNEKEACAVLEQYVREIGLHIDWSKPRKQTTSDMTVNSFNYPDPDLNAAATMIYKKTKLIEIGVYIVL